ncbi:pyridoxamine 5'-phosphate oxidase family protein [Christiangramia flava]|uniref:Pyridoxamine 5'-phosphate oxidase-related, FMN-binding n=1 Tax=Christiangramia flava JLT2011 TaxID=1229726 RepID=A0A1L7I8D2_9FLAO|nr:pyridoxamine 5'-phosphate oxidase family protein [Christiangramia flava]APU69463.1 Pyridoxamine 5'-phosphate oxidase-related, FMN-binding [Christiangramia flava JLT2011]OSS37936.1 hypothetical protein C723_3215 [Christiangramia flava JLT2011]
MKTLTKKECLDFLKSKYIGRLGYLHRDRVEIIPVTYFYDESYHCIISYSGEGEKIRAMRKHPQVAFQVDEIPGLHDWKSVLVYGRYREEKGIDAKSLLHRFSEGVKDLISQTKNTSVQYLSEFSNKVENDRYPIVYRIQLEECSGRSESSVAE